MFVGLHLLSASVGRGDAMGAIQPLRAAAADEKLKIRRQRQHVYTTRKPIALFLLSSANKKKIKSCIFRGCGRHHAEFEVERNLRPSAIRWSSSWCFGRRNMGGEARSTACSVTGMRRKGFPKSSVSGDRTNVNPPRHSTTRRSDRVNVEGSASSNRSLESLVEFVSHTTAAAQING